MLSAKDLHKFLKHKIRKPKRKKYFMQREPKWIRGSFISDKNFWLKSMR